jgi:hypothetical protein
MDARLLLKESASAGIASQAAGFTEPCETGTIRYVGVRIETMSMALLTAPVFRRPTPFPDA